MTCVLKSEMVGKGNYAYAIPFYSERRPILIDLIFMDRKEIEEKYYFILRKGDQLIAETFIPMLNGREDVFLWVLLLRCTIAAVLSWVQLSPSVTSPGINKLKKI